MGILIGPDAVEGKHDRLESFFPTVFADIEELGKERAKPAIIPVGIVRTENPDTHKSFKQMLEVWIAPEIARRIAAGTSRDSLIPVRQALIVFPPLTNPERHRVLLNDEVRVRAAIRPSYNASFAAARVGDEVTLQLSDMFDLRAASLEGVDMRTDGFAWLRPEAGVWTLYFNFLPNSGFEFPDVDKEEVMRAVQDAVAQEMLRAFLKNALSDDPAVRTKMAADGWCLSPILLPEPWRQMCDAYGKGDVPVAEAAALAAVGPTELDRMVGSWVTEEPFTSDRRFLETGIERYKAGDYISVVSVLLPRIEGLANRVRERRGIGARGSIAQVFKSLDELASEDVRDGYLATRIREEFQALITNFLLVQFRPTDPAAAGIRGRHAHAHGATGDPHYDQTYALKIILALDALYFVAR